MTDPIPIRYRAFLSYSHRDDQWGSWLHKTLERTRIDKDLVGRDTPFGAVPSSLRPIFRDRDDYSPGESLSEKTKAALESSDFLIVVCSPNSANSFYVNEEIRLFKKMGRQGRILPVIVDGEPGDPERECFSKALRFKVDRDGVLTDQREEPLAADARPRGDGREGARLKLVAGLLGLALDEIVRRAERERRRVLRLWIGGLSVIAVVFAGLGLLAEINRREAARQRDIVQVSQSQYVAQQARRVASEGDAATAVALALEVLPAPGDERPHVQLAEEALLDALRRLHERTVVRDHGGAVWNVQFSPDGARLITYFVGGVRVLDVASSRTIATLKGENDFVATPALAPDGKRIALAYKDAVVRVWEVETGREIAVLRGHEKSANSLAFSLDGQRLLTASGDRTARLWDAVAGKELEVLRGHEDELTDARFSPDGTRIVTTSYDKTARLWPSDGKGPPVVLEGHTGFVVHAAFSPNGARLVTSGFDATARLWDVAAGKEIATLTGHENIVIMAAFSPDGSRVITASDDKSIGLWDGWTGRRLDFLRGHEAIVNTVAYSRDGAWILSASEDGTARLWNSKDGQPMLILRGHDGPIVDASFSSDSALVATAGIDGTARLWVGLPARDAMVLRGHGREVTSVMFSSDGTRLATASRDNTIGLWDLRSGDRLASLETPMIFPVLWAAPEGVRLVSDEQLGDLRSGWTRATQLRDIASGKVLETWKGGIAREQPHAISADGSLIAVDSLEGERSIWDTRSGQRVSVLQGEPMQAPKSWFSPDGSLIIGTHMDGAAHVWRIVDGEETAVLKHDGLAVNAAAFSPDGKRAATASLDNIARVWDLAQSRVLFTLRGHQSGLTDISFSRDGAWIVTASLDGTARVWDAASGREIQVLRGHRAPVRAAAFSPDGALIATASEDGTAILWSFVTGTRAIAQACERLPRALTTDQRERYFLEREPRIPRCGRKPK